VTDSDAGARPRVAVRESLVERPVDGPHDPARVADPAEREIELRFAGGVEVDRPDAGEPAGERLGRVDVLDALEPRLVKPLGQQPGLDREAPVGDRVGGLDPPQLPAGEHDDEHQQHGGDHPPGLDVPDRDRGDDPGQHAGDDADQQSLDVEPHQRHPRRMAVEEDDLAGLWIHGAIKDGRGGCILDAV
jgi:hypothetical protein